MKKQAYNTIVQNKIWIQAALSVFILVPLAWMERGNVPALLAIGLIILLTVGLDVFRPKKAQPDLIRWFRTGLPVALAAMLFGLAELGIGEMAKQVLLVLAIIWMLSYGVVAEAFGGSLRQAWLAGGQRRRAALWATAISTFLLGAAIFQYYVLPGVSHAVRGWQLALLWACWPAIIWISKNIGRYKWGGVAIFLSLWLVTFLVWKAIPQGLSVYIEKALPPTNQPFFGSDSREYDIYSNMLLGGMGKWVNYFSRPILISIIALLKLAGGSQTLQVINSQLLVIAAVPGLVYLVGTAMRQRGLGLAAGIYLMMHEANALAHPWERVSMANLMTEPWMLFFVLLAAAVFLRLIRERFQPASLIVLYVAVAAVASLVRVNAVALFALPFLFAIPAYQLDLRKWLRLGGLVAITLALVLAPIIVRNVSDGFSAVPYSTKIGDFLKRKDLAPPTQEEARKAAEKAAASPQTGSDEATDLNDGASGTVSPSDRIRFSGISQKVLVNGRFLEAYTVSTGKKGLDLVTHVLRIGVEEPYWIKAGSVGLAFANMVLILLGAWVLWKRAGWVSPALAMLFLAYLATVIIGSEANPRHIIPVGWVISVYYLAGMASLAGLLAVDKPAQATTVPSGTPNRQTLRWVTVTLVLVLACSPLLLEWFTPAKAQAEYNAKNTGMTPSVIAALQQAGISQQMAEDFLQSDTSAGVLFGTAWNPIFLYGGGGFESKGEDFYRLELRLPIEREIYKVSLATNRIPEKIRNGADVIVIGCQAFHSNRFDALAVVLLGPKPKTYLRSPQTDLACPPPPVICENGDADSCQMVREQ